MGYMIQIEEEKIEGMEEHARKILKHGRELIDCIEELAEDSHFGERGNRYGMRDGYYPEERRRVSERRRDDDWEDEDWIGERRGRSLITGRYVRR